MTTPNLCQYLAYVVGRTKHVDVGTAVIVLPWHDPVRVAEEVAMLDTLVGDRTLFVGFGRGASTMEFEGFRVPMTESRDRYNEALEVVRRALTQERFSFEGQFFQIPEMTTYPRPQSPDLGARMYNAWMSPSSLDIAAASGVGPLFAVMRAIDEYPQEMARFNAIRAEAGLAADHREGFVLHLLRGEPSAGRRRRREVHLRSTTTRSRSTTTGELATTAT